MTTRVILAFALSGLLAFGAAAQDQQLHAEAQQKLRALNVDVEIPDDATNQQLTEVITITEQGDMTRSHTTEAEMAERVREVFGME